MDVPLAMEVGTKLPGHFGFCIFCFRTNYLAVRVRVAGALLAARAHQLMGESELAHASYDSARAILEKELDAHLDDHRIHSALGIAYGGLGHKEIAIHEGKWGVELLPVSKDALIGPARVLDLAEIYTMVGEYDAALEEIEYVLSLNGWWSVQELRLDPIWDPLRDQPRFQELLEKYSGDDL